MAVVILIVALVFFMLGFGSASIISVITNVHTVIKEIKEMK